MLNDSTPNYSAWALSESLTVEEAACLWAGVEPTSYAIRRYSFNDPAAAAVAPLLRMLSSAIEIGTLEGDTRTNAFLARSGDHARTRVTREALMIFASRKNQRPPFLFDTLLPAEPPAKNANVAGKNKGGAPAKWDWDRCILEIIRIADLPDGLPETQNGLVGKLADWFVAEYGDHPAESQIKEKTTRIYKYLGRSRKPPVR